MLCRRGGGWPGGLAEACRSASRRFTNQLRRALRRCTPAGHTTVVGTPLHLGSQPSGAVATPAMLLFGTVLKGQQRSGSGLRTGSGLRR